MAQQVSDYVLERLTEWGVHRIYGYPGDGINAFLGAFDRAEGDPEFIQVRHEEMAAFMACAHAKFTGEIGVCIATSGPGAIHLLNGLYDAKLDHQPVLAIDRPAEADVARRALPAGDRPEHAVQGRVRVRATRARIPRRRAISSTAHQDRAGRARRRDDHRPGRTSRRKRRRRRRRATHGAVYSSVGYLEPRMIPKTEDLQRGRGHPERRARRSRS